MEKILVIDESSIFRDFIKAQLEYYGFNVIGARSSFTGLARLRESRPDLVIIDDEMNRISVNSFLQKKKEDTNLISIPVIFTARQFKQDRIVELCRVKARRFLLKPLKIDQFLNTVSAFFYNNLYVDETPCQLNMHVNDNLILVEIARGLNKTKLNLLRWKIQEIVKVNQIGNPKIMLLISDIKLTEEAGTIIKHLLNSVSHIPDSIRDIKILTQSKEIKRLVQSNLEFHDIDVCSTLIEAVKAFFGKNGLEKLTNNQDYVHKLFLSTGEEYETSGIIDLNFKEELLPV